MLFNSAAFVFVFLPAAIISYFLIGRAIGARAAIAWLVVLSLVFYGHWRPADLPVLAASILINFSAAQLIIRTRSPHNARFLMIATVAGNLLMLGVYKYAGLVVTSANTLMTTNIPAPEFTLPLGISFFTFLQIAYVVDVWRERQAEPNLIRYSLFVTFFPHLIAGPILHHKEMLPQFTPDKTRIVKSEDLAVGITIFAFGLFKKLVLADGIAGRADLVFSAAAAGAPLSTAEAWMGAVSYAFQIYFDFSAYSDMAIGLARMFGIRLPVNFNSPYKATSIIEFWRRWHMTLSRFLRNYLYIPLGGNRKGPVRRYVNVMVTMLLGGLWHGASWTFVAWGALHGIFLVINHGWIAFRGVRPPLAGLRRGACIALTFLLVTLAWVPFRAENFPTAGRMMHAMLGLDGISLPRSLESIPGMAVLGALGFRFDGMFLSQAFGEVYSGLIIVLLLGAVVWCHPNTQEVLSRFDPALGFRAESTRTSFTWAPSLRWAVAIGAVFGIALTGLAHPVRFIYFNF